jgi:hypothetical protein
MASHRDEAAGIPPLQGAPTGLQLDLLTIVMRLRQYRTEAAAGNWDLAWWLLNHRILECDLPRLEGHLNAETRDWAARYAADLEMPDPLA